MKRILYGVCGIGHGHSYRQLPIIQHFARDARLAVFAYGHSLDFYRRQFAGYSNVAVLPVAVPFYVCTPTGIDHAATAAHPANRVDFTAINTAALQAAANHLERPDLVISDYEPVCAEYAVQNEVPLVTLDQQSKYLYGTFPPTLNGQTPLAETLLLYQFFPQVTQRIACSFFNVPPRSDGLPVTLIPPVLRPEIGQQVAAGEQAHKPYLLVYTSAQQALPQALKEVLALCRGIAMDFHVISDAPPPDIPANVHLHPRSAADFVALLRGAAGVISTAGHTLLSEALHLEIPVLALPLPIYEQQMNARIVQQGNFGCAAARLDLAVLQEFVRNLAAYRQQIIEDRQVLLKGDGLQAALTQLNRYFSP